ncbi:MAG: FKBP-type peptidyl-prolyl cis-trans isomerase [Pseudomonadota bacterium]
MKNLTSALLLAAGLTTAGSVGANQDMQDLSYSLGALIGDRILAPYQDIDYDRLMAGLKAAHQKAELEIDLNTANQMVAEAAEAQAKAPGEAFLAEQAAREGVMSTDSGLLYEVKEAGEGAKPAATDQVTVHYEGRLIDGTVFDSSIERGEPTSFALNQVIPGWTEGLQLMSVGSKYTFYIPSDLAYGPRGAGGSIGPHQALVFDVELIAIGN